MPKTNLINNIFTHTSNDVSLMYIGATKDSIIHKAFNHSDPTITFGYIGVSK